MAEVHREGRARLKPFRLLPLLAILSLAGCSDPKRQQETLNREAFATPGHELALGESEPQYLTDIFFDVDRVDIRADQVEAVTADPELLKAYPGPHVF